jgi:hypothetical protein
MKFLLCFVCCASHASDLCLMLSPTEEAALTRAQQQARKGEQANNSDTLRLDGIIYSHPKSWTIWLNGRAIKAGESVDTFRIINVTPESVEMIWSPKQDQHHQICLKPNETFQRKSQE